MFKERLGNGCGFSETTQTDQCRPGGGHIRGSDTHQKASKTPLGIGNGNKKQGATDRHTRERGSHVLADLPRLWPAPPPLLASHLPRAVRRIHISAGNQRGYRSRASTGASSSSSTSFCNACVSIHDLGGRLRSFLGLRACPEWASEKDSDEAEEEVAKRASRKSHQALRSQFGSGETA